MAPRLTTCILVTPVLPTPHRALAEISLCSPLHLQIATANRADTVLWTFASGFFLDPTARHGVSPLRAQKRTYQLFTRAGSALEPQGLSPALAELILDALEAAVEMIDPADSGLALRGKAGDDQRHRSAHMGHGSLLSSSRPNCRFVVSNAGKISDQAPLRWVIFSRR